MISCPRCQESFEESVRFCPRDGAPLGADRAPGEVIQGRYRLGDRIGTGGMAAVFRAEHVHLGRPFALKFISRELLSNEEAVRRFEREAQLASRLRHPNVVEVVDYGRTEDGQPFLAMELLEGTNLKDLVAGGGPLPLERVREIARQVGSALEYAHAQGVVHRDLKSANVVLFRETDGSERVKVLDFGISKGPEALSQGLTVAGAVMGTPEYMSPEQASGSPVDARSDLYSLGIVVYEALTGAVPFRGTTGAVLSAQITQPPAPLREARPDLPAAVEAVVLRALAKEPAQRFDSVRAFRESFDAACVRAEGTTAVLPPRRDLPAAGGTALFGAPAVAPTASSAPAAELGSRDEVPATAETAMLGSRPPPRAAAGRWAIAVVAGALAAAIALAAVLWRRDPAKEAVPPAAPPPRVAAPAPPLPVERALPRAAELVRAGKLAEARAHLARLVDPRAVCLRAQVGAALGDGAAAVTDAERCIDLLPSRRGDPAVARAVVQALGTEARKRAYELLVGDLALAARAPLLEAAHHSSKLVRAGAHRAAKKLGYLDAFDEVGKLILDLREAGSCASRKRLVVALAKRGDPRALPHLERELSRSEAETRCFDERVFSAVRKLRQASARPASR